MPSQMMLAGVVFRATISYPAPVALNVSSSGPSQGPPDQTTSRTVWSATVCTATGDSCEASLSNELHSSTSPVSSIKLPHPPQANCRAVGGGCCVGSDERSVPKRATTSQNQHGGGP